MSKNKNNKQSIIIMHCSTHQVFIHAWELFWGKNDCRAGWLLPSTTTEWADPSEDLQMLACLMLPPKSSGTRFAIEGMCQVHFPGVFTSAGTGRDTE